ncbi:hypothetical protein IWX63_000986 [Arthrobacter sp. CAN_A2]|uniref:septum formation family protein n=1 Tax=Arthrobacter sp. CAN_A2 TaxID=2787718 RepID=UPI0018EF9A64
MSNEEQVPADPSHEPGPDGAGEPEGADVLDPDTVVLDDPDISAEALEPELTVSPDTLDLEEPALEPAQISPEVAEAASLDDAAAEARAVAAAAEEARTLVGGPLPPGAPVAMPPGEHAVTPAGAASVDPVDVAADRTGEAAAAPPGEYAVTPAGWVPTTPGGEPASEAHPKRDRTRSRSGFVPLLLVAGGAVVLLGLVAWLLLSLFGGSEDEGRVDPSSLAAGDCLAEFTDITEEAVLVDCSEPHNAQLVASEDYADDAEFPGRDQLGLRAEAACAAASAGIDPDVVTEDLQVTLLRATPTEGTWADGDRRVDCFAVVEDGGPVSHSLLDP